MRPYIAQHIRLQRRACLSGCSAEPKVLGEEEVPAMKWGAPDTEGLVKFLVEEKSFNEDRVRRAVERINSSRGKSNQGAYDSMVCWPSPEEICTEDTGSTCLPMLAAHVSCRPRRAHSSP